MRIRGVSALERSAAKQFATGGSNQVLGCTNVTLVPTGSHINKKAQVVLVKQLHPTHQLNNVVCKIIKHTKHKNLIALQSQGGGGRGTQ
jgi:hypothetical protein